MNNTPSIPHFQLADLCYKMERDPAGFVMECHNRYHAQIRQTAAAIAADPNHKIIMLAGPSSAGKTTTANLLRSYLAADCGVQSLVISLDDFYLGKGQAPLLPDGSYDYESVHALNIPLLQECMLQLITNGACRIPQFNFAASAPEKERVPIQLAPGDLIIFEGIHALNSLILDCLPRENLTTIYIDAQTTVYDGAKLMIPPREIRLARRMVRDSIYRNADAQRTLRLWTAVVRGEDKYLFPFKDTVDYKLNTFHEFEPGILKPWLIPLLKTVRPGENNAILAANMLEDYDRFPVVSPKLLPQNCLLHEFIDTQRM